MTAVIGPNGCGKSNLFDAMRWVMGETRPSSVRGSEMDDVIFSGSAGRPARNVAEVTLFIDNADRKAVGPYAEFVTIEVSRRIEREAGSVYRINGRDVRLRVVLFFFADASSGAGSDRVCAPGPDRPSDQPGNRWRAAPSWKKPPGSAGCISAAMRSRTAPRVRRRNQSGAAGGCDPGSRRPAGQPEAPGAPGFALPQPLRPYPQGRSPGAFSALGGRSQAPRRRWPAAILPLLLPPSSPPPPRPLPARASTAAERAAGVLPPLLPDRKRGKSAGKSHHRLDRAARTAGAGRSAGARSSPAHPAIDRPGRRRYRTRTKPGQRCRRRARQPFRGRKNPG